MLPRRGRLGRALILRGVVRGFVGRIFDWRLALVDGGRLRASSVADTPHEVFAVGRPGLLLVALGGRLGETDLQLARAQFFDSYAQRGLGAGGHLPARDAP